MSDWKKQIDDRATCHQRFPETVSQSQSEYPLHHPLCPCSKDGDAVAWGCCTGLWCSS